MVNFVLFLACTAPPERVERVLVWQQPSVVIQQRKGESLEDVLRRKAVQLAQSQRRAQQTLPESRLQRPFLTDEMARQMRMRDLLLRPEDAEKVRGYLISPKAP